MDEKLISVDNRRIVHAMVCGFILGLMPKNNLLWCLAMFFILFFRINKPIYVIMILLGTLISPLFDGIFDTIGYSFLTVKALGGIFGTLLDIPFVAFTKFNNSVVMGAFLCGLVLYFPLYLLFNLLVSLYKKNLFPRIKESKFGRVLAHIPILGKMTGMAGGN